MPSIRGRASGRTRTTSVSSLARPVGRNTHRKDWRKPIGGKYSIETKTQHVDKYDFEYALQGNGGPVVVFLNGFRMHLSTWDKVWAPLDLSGRIFAYNRLGTGKSSRPNTDQTASAVIAQLQALLAALALPPPYVLVAHSVGGIFAHYYAKAFPEEVAGVVFVDAAHPEEAEIQMNFKPPLPLRAINESMKAVERLFDPYRHSEAECMAASLGQIQAAPPFPPIPIAVLSGRSKMPFVPKVSFEIHLAYQAKTLELSPHATEYAALQSGHFPQVTEPDVVIKAITETVSAVNAIPPAGNGAPSRLPFDFDSPIY